MCTAVSWNGLFGRTLDLEYSYEESVTIMPRRFPLAFRDTAAGEEGYALMGMAYVREGYPLYYDAVNEKGLGMAGLNFPGCAVYKPAAEGRDNVASFELIPWVLRQCATVEEARARLTRVTITDSPFHKNLPPTPLHWMISDGVESLVAEQTGEGVTMYENPVGVLTNNPPFPVQMLRLSDCMQVTNEAAENRLAPGLELQPYSRGMGGIGLPGDWSSTSRFVRSAFAGLHSIAGQSEAERVGQFFHIMDTVSQVRGCVKLGENSYVTTRYTSCCDLAKGIYYYTTYENRSISAVSLHREDLDGSELISCPLLREERIAWQN